jgi:dihydrofolate reductase
MRGVIEYTLISVDGVVENPERSGYLAFRDDAYLRDGLGVLLTCDALLLGRRTYQGFAKVWPGRNHPWADRMNEMKKYVFSSTLKEATWQNTTILRGHIPAEVARLRQEDGGDLLVLGHGRIGQALLGDGLIDLLDLSIHPLVVGHGQQFFREGQSTGMTLAAAKTFSKIVKLTYKPQRRSDLPSR